MIHPFFEHSFCINLQRRPDRWNSANQEFINMDIPIWWMNGIDMPEDPATGDNLVHHQIIKHAQVEKWDHVVIFEDDVHFVNNPKEVILKALEELPSDWDMFYLGGNVDGPCKQVGNYLARLSHCQSVHAYAIRHTLYEQVAPFDQGDLDLFYCKNIIPQHRCFITIPMVAIQGASYSDIQKTNVNYETWMEERFWINLRRGK